MTLSNNPPRVQWFETDFPCGTTRHRLYVDGSITPYFVDHARVIAHRMNGSMIGLFGAGMGSTIRRRDGSEYQIAAQLGGYRKMSEAKRAAEQLALS